MSEVIEMLENIENGSVYIGTVDKKGHELKNELLRLSNWIVEQVNCNWCSVKDCFDAQEEEYIKPLFNVFLDDTICKEIDAFYFDNNNYKIIEQYVNSINESLKKIDIENDFFTFYKKYAYKHVSLLSMKYNIKRDEDVEKKIKVVDTSKDLPEIELRTQKEQIKILYELGVIDFLQDRYPATLRGNNNQISVLLSKILKHNKVSVQPTLNALLNNDARNKNYPKETKGIKSIIDKLNSNESN